MKSTPIFYVFLVLSMIFFILPGYGYAMKTYHGRVADPVTGAAVANAQVFDIARCPLLVSCRIFLQVRIV